MALDPHECGCEQSYLAKYGKVTTNNMIQHLLFDETIPGACAPRSTRRAIMAVLSVPR